MGDIADGPPRVVMFAVITLGGLTLLAVAPYCQSWRVASCRCCALV